MITLDQLKDAQARLSASYPDISEEYLKSILGLQWKRKLSTISRFCKLFIYIYPDDPVYRPLSTHSDKLQAYLPLRHQTQHELSFYFRELQKLHLLEKVSDEYHYNSLEQTASVCYYCNKGRCKEFLQFLEQNYKKLLSVYPSKSDLVKGDTPITTKKSGKKTILTDIRISSNCKHKCSESDAYQGLLLTYSYLYDYFKLANNINDLILEKGLSHWGAIKYNPNFESKKIGRSTYITRIGLRASTPLCKLRKAEKADPGLLCRESVLKDVFGKDGWMEVDIKSSVPRVAFLLKSGLWMNNTCDFYEAIFGDLKRETAKLLFMILYFTSSLPEAKKSCLYNHLDIEFDKLPYYYDQILLYLGPSKGSEIFMHESHIYLRVRQDLAMRGIECLQVYDGFYFKMQSTTEDEVLKIVEREALAYYSSLY